MKTRVVLALVASFALVQQASATDKALMGAIIGAGAGAVIGHAVDRTGGAGKGAAIGAIGGYILGSQMEKRESTASTATAAPRRRADSGATLAQRCARGQKYFDRAQRTLDKDEKVYLLQMAAHYCPGDARVHNDLGVAYYERGLKYDRKRAKMEFEEALRINPDYRIARENLNAL